MAFGKRGIKQRVGLRRASGFAGGGGFPGASGRPPSGRRMHVHVYVCAYARTREVTHREGAIPGRAGQPTPSRWGVGGGFMPPWGARRPGADPLTPGPRRQACMLSTAFWYPISGHRCFALEFSDVGNHVRSYCARARQGCSFRHEPSVSPLNEVCTGSNPIRSGDISLLCSCRELVCIEVSLLFWRVCVSAAFTHDVTDVTIQRTINEDEQPKE